MMMLYGLSFDSKLSEFCPTGRITADKRLCYASSKFAFGKLLLSAERYWQKVIQVSPDVFTSQSQANP
jgi:hypothetical protein